MLHTQLGTSSLGACTAACSPRSVVIEAMPTVIHEHREGATALAEAKCGGD